MAQNCSRGGRGREEARASCVCVGLRPMRRTYSPAFCSSPARDRGDVGFKASCIALDDESSPSLAYVPSNPALRSTPRRQAQQLLCKWCGEAVHLETKARNLSFPHLVTEQNSGHEKAWEAGRPKEAKEASEATAGRNAICLAPAVWRPPSGSPGSWA